MPLIGMLILPLDSTKLMLSTVSWNRIDGSAAALPVDVSRLLLIGENSFFVWSFLCLRDDFCYFVNEVSYIRATHLPWVTKNSWFRINFSDILSLV